MSARVLIIDDEEALRESVDRNMPVTDAPDTQAGTPRAG